MTLGQKQRQFTRMIGLLIEYAYQNGYELTFGGKKSYSSANSLHKERLAVDFNLFKNGVWLQKTEDFTQLGQYWESLGGTWGGRFQDGNHFSLEHQGRK